MHANGETIRYLRERTGLSKTALATAAGMHPTHLHRIETGERKGTDAQIVSIARVLMVPTTAIIRDEVA